MAIAAIETRYAGCAVAGCNTKVRAKGLCRLHWERQHNTGRTDDPAPRTGAANPAWKGDAATYSAVHLRLTTTVQRPASCETCGADRGRFEWALRTDAPTAALLVSPDGLRYSTNPDHYANLCKACHNKLDLGRDGCKRGHEFTDDNTYVQPSTGKRFCRTCAQARRRQRTLRDQAKGRG